MADARSDPVIVVSNDTHIGPRLVDDLRQYCPSAYLEDFDRFSAETAAQFQATVSTFNGGGFLHHPNLRTLGHYDSAARLADYNYDGIAAGVIFHGSMNMEPIPFISGGVGVQNRGDAELMRVGQHVYNQWLADFVSQAPHRHVGLAYVPIWDLDAAVAEVEWAHEAGLRGVNFPAMRDGELLEYNDPSWEPLWAVCEERKMPLVTHIGGGSKANYSGPEKVPLIQFESAYMSRRAVWWLILAGVFERRPGLKLVITETPGNWFPSTAIELDAIHRYYTDRDTPLNAEFVERVPRLPSEYMKTNVFVGASFASAFEVEQAILHGLDRQLLWGSDYPHLEGTFLNPDDRDMPSVTRLSLRNTFCEVPAAQTLRMVGENAIEVYNLDAAALRSVAREIDALTTDDLAAPIDAVPAGASRAAFRSGQGGWS
jgi:predicted TIM-barrel fold metal-dependent hydrolase